MSDRKHGAYTNKNGGSNTGKSAEDYWDEFAALAEAGLPAGNETPTAPWQRFFLTPGSWSDYNEETGEAYETWVDARSGEVRTYYPVGSQGMTPEWLESMLTNALGEQHGDDESNDEQSNGEGRS